MSSQSIKRFDSPTQSKIGRKRCPTSVMMRTPKKTFRLASTFLVNNALSPYRKSSKVRGISVERWFAFFIAAAVPFVWWTRPAAVTKYVNELLKYLQSDEVVMYVRSFHRWLELVGAPPPYPGSNELALILVVFTWSGIFYWLLFGKTHLDHRMELQDRLDQAKQEVQDLNRQLEEEAISIRKKLSTKPVRIFMEGAFDLMHYGHMNAFRLGHSLGTELVVGVNSDESITKCKGCAPCMSDEERQTAVGACRFVKEVVPNVPYVMTPKYLNMIIEKYDIDYVVHGDDPCIVNGEDVYGHVKRMKKFKSIPRTEGVSTTDIVGRMLLCTKSHHQVEEGQDTNKSDDIFDSSRSSTFYTTSSLLQQFSLNARPRSEGESVVYIDGAWDLFHAGHSKILKEARKFGDYLIVGVHSDALVNARRGGNFPIMNLNERVLSVLGCKFVDDVLISSPWEVTAEMIHSLNIKAVVRGNKGAMNSDRKDSKQDEMRYAAPRQKGIFKILQSPSDLCVDQILSRINLNRERYMAKFQKKKAKEDEYYDGRYGRAKEERASLRKRK